MPSSNYDYTEDENFTDISTITMNKDQNIRIRTHVDPFQAIPPYFKVFDDFIPKEGVSRVARLHIKDEYMEYHNDKYWDWILTEDDIRYIKNLLMKSNGMFPKYTNW